MTLEALSQFLDWLAEDVRRVFLSAVLGLLFIWLVDPPSLLAALLGALFAAPLSMRLTTRVLLQRWGIWP